MLLEGKKGLVLNVTNKNSIGWGIAQQAVNAGALVGVGAQNERMFGKVQQLTEGQENFRVVTIDFQEEGAYERLAEQVSKEFGKIDFLVHSAAFADRADLEGQFINTSKAGFLMAMEVSAYSLIELSRTLAPLMNDDGSVMALTYLGSQRLVQGYNVMGVAKAALEASVRYLAGDLGQRGIRVNAISPGPINTVAARGVKGLSEMIQHVQKVSPLQREYGPDEVGGTAVYLASDLSRGVTGQIIYVDSGYNTLGMLG